MKRLTFTCVLPLACAAILAAGCSHHTQSAPSLTAAPDAPQTAPKKDFFTRTADATWNTVSAPVRLLTPQKKPATPPPEPVTYEAPEAIIIVPQAEGGEGLLGVASQPPATQPK